MAELKITSQELQNNIMTISLKGFLDSGTYNDLGEIIYNCFGQNKYHLIVDLSQLEYISSSGAMILIGAFGVTRENQGKLVLLCPKPKVKEIFDLLGFSQVLLIADNMDAALKSIKTS